MRIGELLRWQWEGYPRYHQARRNLLVHGVAVPLFQLGTLGLVGALIQFSPELLGVATACIMVSVALQGRGHRLEPIPPEPFTGPLNFVVRLLLEQWITFPRFVLSGGWIAALRHTRIP